MYILNKQYETKADEKLVLCPKSIRIKNLCFLFIVQCDGRCDVESKNGHFVILFLYYLRTFIKSTALS